jgi:hypothetical protein
MKKSMLFLICLQAIVGHRVFSQELSGTLTCPVPRAIDVTCLASDALHPLPGVPYTYAVTVPSPPGVKSFRWIVTQEQTFLTSGLLNLANAESAGGQHVSAAGPELNSTTAEGTGEDISITWKSFTHDPSRPLFLVIYVENSDGCITQNLKVFQIQPQEAFTLDIAGVKTDGTVMGWDVPAESCVSDIASARYDAAATDGMVYDYGTNYLFFAVTAANFSTSWQPAFQLAGTTAAQASTIEWAYASAPATWNAASTVVEAKSSDGSVGASGECIIVRVTVRHNSEEVLAAMNITLAVDGLTNLAAPVADRKPDLHFTGAQCGQADGFGNDIAVHTLKPRPTVQKL